MRRFGLYIFSPLLSYFGGFLAYIITLKLIWNETLGGDLSFVCIYGGIAFFIIGFPIYLGIISFVDKKFHKYKGMLYPLGCMLIFFIPTLFITLRFGSLDLFTPESMLFHSFFLTSGLIFGICHWVLKKASFAKIPVSLFMMIVIIVFVIWFLYEKSTSYSQPQEALSAIENDLWLIPASEQFDEALFFFIKDQNNLGATIVHEGLFGWKAGNLTWSSIDTKRNYEKLNGYQKHDENLIYGIIKDGTNRQIKVNENDAHIVHLLLPSNVIEDYQLEDLYIWYFESDSAIEEGKIKLINKQTQELLDSINL